MEVNQTLHDVWPSPRVVHHIYTFSGLLPGAKFTLFPNLAFSYTGIRALGVSQTLWRSAEGITYTIFGRAAITLDIGPHSSKLIYYNARSQAHVTSRHIKNKVKSNSDPIYKDLLWPPCVADADIIFLSCGFFYLLFSFSSPILSRRRLDVYHTSTYGVALVRI